MTHEEKKALLVKRGLKAAKEAASARGKQFLVAEGGVLRPSTEQLEVELEATAEMILMSLSGWACSSCNIGFNLHSMRHPGECPSCGAPHEETGGDLE